MSRLTDLQHEFTAALFDPEQAVPSALVSHTARTPERRFNVHRNNLIAGLILVLESRHPGLVGLLGRDYFKAVAHGFVVRHPPRTPVLLAWGDGLDAFLRELPPTREHPYLPDVARLEWLQHEAFHAADARPLDAAALGALDPAELPRTGFVLHPALRGMASAHPVLSIWRRAMGQDTCGGPLAGAEEVLILRPGIDVELRRVPPGTTALVDGLRTGLPLGEAAAAAREKVPEIDLRLALATLIDSDAFVAVEPPAT